MRTLFLLRHSLTEANERRLYCGSTDLPLSDQGRLLAKQARPDIPPVEWDLCVTSGVLRANETLALLTDRRPDLVLPGLREMDFGRFEMKSYDQLREDADYLRWIGDETGEVSCPGGECSRDFAHRVCSEGDTLLKLEWQQALVVCHGGVVVRLMQHWFPAEPKGFYEWQPSACGGWRVTFEKQTAVGFDSV